ncbi:MAG: spore cortex biosynthesis protein YabQ, partial [Defluviitaleaceae bacterium]|nr:spore cortex biosynthesis protein YabQ [Defluviitaleaceae bacterium]
YWVLASVGMFIFIQYTMAGEVRAYLIFGAFLGALLYFTTLSVAIMAVSSAIIGFVKKVLATALAMALIPLRLAVRLLSIPTRALKNILRPAKKSAKKLLQNSITYGRIKKQKLTRDAFIILRKR